MSSLSSALFSFKGQCVQSFSIEKGTHSVLVRCRRDRRFKVEEPRTGRLCTVDHYVRRQVQDLPVSGHPCHIEVELAQTRDKDGRRLIEATEYVAKGGFVYIPLLKVIIKYLARLKLDFDLDYDDLDSKAPLEPFKHGLVTIGSGWFPQVAIRNLSVLEVALLAGVSNIRSVRNAQYDKDNPLNFYKEGKKVLIKLEDARRWLTGRKGFVTSKSVTPSEEIIH